MLRTTLFTAIIFTSLSGTNARAASIGVVVEVYPAGVAIISGSSTGFVKTGQIIMAGDKITLKRRGKIRILTLNRERITLKNSGTYSFTSGGRVQVLVKGKSSPRVKSVIARLRTLRGFGVSRGGPKVNLHSATGKKPEISPGVKKELKRINMIRDPYLRHLARFYIYDRYGYTKMAAEAAKRSSRYGE